MVPFPPTQGVKRWHIDATVRAVTGLELCLIDDPADPEHLLLARRLDDASAVVVTVTPPGRRQRFGDRVALQGPADEERRAAVQGIEATTLAGRGGTAGRPVPAGSQRRRGSATPGPRPSMDARASLWRSSRGPGGIARFRAGRTLEQGGFQTDRLEAPHPGEAALVRLDRQIAARGWALAVRELPSVGRMVELLLATPSRTSAVEIDALLGALTGEWTQPPAYPELAARSGGNEAVHLARRRAYAARCAAPAAPVQTSTDLIG